MASRQESLSLRPVKIRIGVVVDVERSVFKRNKRSSSLRAQGGATKNKLARVSGAHLQMDERDLKMYISGTPVQLFSENICITQRCTHKKCLGTSASGLALWRTFSLWSPIGVPCANLCIKQSEGCRVQVSRAKDYIAYVLSQRVGPRVVVDATHYREDLSIVDVPELLRLLPRGCQLQDCVAYIMGRGGKVLRGIEEEWNTLMFFAEVRGGKFDGREKLAIFGARRARRGAELKVNNTHPSNHTSTQPWLRGRMPSLDANRKKTYQITIEPQYIQPHSPISPIHLQIHPRPAVNPDPAWEHRNPRSLSMIGSNTS
eukprot:5248598-Pyramimonas_sp.AAC.2